MRLFSKKSFFFAGSLALLSAALFAKPAAATLISYEGFNYDDGTSIKTQTGGTGWSDAWADASSTSTETATAPGLTYSTLSVLGNMAALAGQQNNSGSNGGNAFMFRTVGTAQGADGTTVWLSFIGQRTGVKSSGGTTPPPTPIYQRLFGMSLYSGTTTEKLAVGEVSAETTNQNWCSTRSEQSRPRTARTPPRQSIPSRSI